MAGFDDGFVLVGARVREGEAGGVLHGEAGFAEGVGGEVARGGEALFFVLGGFLCVVAAAEEGDGVGEQRGVFGDPAVAGEGQERGVVCESLPFEIVLRTKLKEKTFSGRGWHASG